jgi:hypothetical protein
MLPKQIHFRNFTFAIMNLIAKLLLMLFLASVSTPSIVSLIKKNSDSVYFFSSSEEEQVHKLIKIDFHLEVAYTIGIFLMPTSSLILYENFLKHNNIAAAIFIPPPKLV